jgi:hypothetical protein
MSSSLMSLYHSTWKEWNNDENCISWLPEEVVKDILLSIRQNVLEVCRQNEGNEVFYYRSVNCGRMQNCVKKRIASSSGL